MEDAGDKFIKSFGSNIWKNMVINPSNGVCFYCDFVCVQVT
nr:MAG TPA: hypothetical protein [Caudoviricetes sp.]